MKNFKNFFIINLFLIGCVLAQDNYSLSFDGIDDWVDAPSINLTNQVFTIEAWVKIPPATHSARTNIIDSYETNSTNANKWGIYVTSTTDNIGDGYINIAEFGVPDFYSSNPIDDNSWHHFALVRNSNGSLLFFLDGVLDNNDNTVPLNTDFNTGFSTKIGSGHNVHAGRRYMECTLGDLQVSYEAKYSSNFSPQVDVSTSSSSILHFDFNEGSGNSLSDLSGNSNNGTINGSSWSTTVPITGCTNQYADNYNSNANFNVGCEFEQSSNSFLYTVSPGGNTLTDYELLFEVPDQDEMSSDYSDVLFVDSFNNVLSSYVSEYDESSAKIWVKLDTLFSSSSNSILCFYGESSFSNPNDPFKVFTLYENFDNGSFYNTWTVNNQNGASQTFDNGTMKLNVTQTDEFVSVDSEQTFDLSGGYAFEVKYKSQSNRGHFAVGMGDGNSKERTSSGGYNLQNGFVVAGGHDGDVDFKTKDNGSQYEGSFENSTGVFNNFHTFELTKFADDYFTATYNNNTSGQTTDESKLNEGEHPFYFWANGWDGQSRSVWVDEIKVRKIANPLPSVNNISPLASNISASTAEDTDLSGTLSGSDADGDDLTYAIASNPSNGTVTLNSASDGTFTYSPTNNYNGTDSFTYTASDGTDTSEPATVTITITAVIDKYYIASTGSDNNNGSVNSPFVTIQAGINVSEDNDTVFVAAGTYTENINLAGKTIYLKGANAGTTIIDGGQNGSAVKIIGGEGSGTTIRYFTIKNGLATNGGGVLVDNSSNLNLLDVIITGNSADYGAGVSTSDNSNVTIKNTLLYSNESVIQGGALYVSESSQVSAISSTITYNSVSGNSGSASGNGVNIGTASSFISNSSIIWGNTGNFSQINIPDPQFGGSASITYSNIGGGWYGTGNVNADPYFTDSDNGDFTLEDYSSLIGLAASTGLPEKDLAGNARPNPAGSTSDMGAYENENASSQRAMTVQNLDIGGQEDLQHISDHTPLISFDYSDNASQTQTTYQVQVSTESDFSDINMWDTGEVASSETSTTYAGTELVDGATYHIRAKVSASDFASGWATASFRLNSTVAVGNLTFNPEYNESNVYTTIEFPTISSSPSADSESDALSVKYILSTNSSFTNKVDSSTVAVSSSTASWMPSIDPSDNQQYWVKASTYDGYEYGVETDASTFILNNENDAPDAFALSSPVGGAEVTSLKPVLDWPDVNDVDPLDLLNYTLYLDTPDPGITTIEVGTASTYEISTSLEDNTTYYWKIKATDAAGLSRENTGGYQSFRVNTENDLPAQFSLLAPENTSMVTDLTPTLLWNEPTDADDRNSRSIDSYSVYIGTDNAFTDVIPVVVTSNNYTPSSSLIEDILYYWKVIATDDDGGETTSATWSFWTNSMNSAPAQFTLTSPEEGDETELAPTFTWNKSSDDDLNDQLSYTLSLGSNQSLLDDIEVSSNSSSNNYSLSFDGEDDYVLIGDNGSLDNVSEEFTISAIVKFSNVTDQGYILSKRYFSAGSGYEIRVANGLLYAEVNPGGSAITLTTPIEVDDNFHTIIATFKNEDHFRLYLDGQLVNDFGLNATIGTETDFSASSLVNDENLVIGEFSSLDGRVFNGLIAELSIYSESDNTFDGNLIAHWDFSEGSGSTLTDLSGNGNNGTINGASWSNDAPSNNLNSISYTPSTDLTDNTEYHWQVTAEDQSGATYTTPLQSFVVNSENDLPSSFALLSPGNTTMVTDLTPELHWEEPTDPDLQGSIASYSVYVSTDNSFADVTPAVVATNTHTISTDLTEDALHYWKVVATDDDGGETSSATWSFWTNSINSAPAEYTLISPEQDEETGLTPTFSWNESTDADLYDEIAYTLSYGTDPSDLTDVISSSGDNYSLSFDGVDDFAEINLAYGPTTSNSFTVLFWINPKSNRSYLIAKYENLNESNSNFYLSINENDVFVISGDGTNSLTFGTPNYDEWQHIAVSFFTNGETFAYLNGVLAGEGVLNLASTISNMPFELGSQITGLNDAFFEGVMDEVSFWNSALSQEEIQTIINSGLIGNEDYLLGYWNFNEGEGSVLTDISGNGNNGTINGATWSNDARNSGSSGEVLSGTSYTPNQDLTDDTQYHWQVTAEDQSGATYTTPLQSFVVNAENDLPSDFDLLSPGNTTMVTDLTPELHWEEPIDPDLQGSITSYSVYVSTDNSFADVTPEAVATNTLTISTDLTEDALHYWKVVATDDDGGETSSATWSFWTNSINSAPAEFTLISPEQDEETGLTPTFSWNESSDADLYDEIAYTLSYGTDPSDLTDVTSSSGESSGGGYSLSFDGIDDYVFMDFLSDDVDNSSITLMGWFKSTSNGIPDIYHEGIMGFRNYPQSDGNFYATMNWTGWGIPTIEMFGGTSVNISLTPDDGTWYHLAMTYDGIYTTSFLNGIIINTAITDNDPIVPSIQLLLGNNNANGEHHFKGLIDDVSLWSVALDADEIQSYMTGSPSENQNNLVGYWNFNQGSGEVLTDLSSNGNDGVIVGATWSTDVPETGSSGEAISGTSYTPLTDLTDDTEYHWQVTAEDQSGATYTTPLQSFVVNAENDLLSDFALLSPGNTTMVTDLTPELHWEEPTDPDLQGSIASYSVYVSTDNSFADVTPEVVATNTYTIPIDLTEDALHYWKVVATDDDGGETSSATWSFWTNSINSAPAEFTLVSPEQDEETGLTPTFNWNESSDADLYDEIAYRLSFGTDPSILDDVLDISNSEGEDALTSFTVDEELVDNTRYHWQVTAEDQSGATYTTPLQSFIVNDENDLPSDFALISPDSMAMVTDLTPTLHWQEPTDDDVRNSRSIESYNVYINSELVFDNVNPVVVNTNYYEVENELDENMLYFWRVVAVDDDGGETISDTSVFWTNNENSSPAEFFLLTPEEGEETILTPTFTWTESNDEDLYDVIGYTLKYGTDPTALDLVEPFEAGTNINYSLSFDGEDDYILMENFQIPEPYLYDATIELWFKSNIDPQSFSEEGFQGAHLLKKSGIYEEIDLRLFEDSLGFEWESNIFGIQEGAQMLQGAYNDASWHHYAVQISDSTILSVYIDGVKAYEEIISEEAPNFFDFSGPFTNLLLGTNSDQQSSFFKGLISEMKISSVAQYAENFNPDSLIVDESTVSLWKFNANLGNVLFDLSGNENHGAIYGEPTWTTDVPALYGQAGLIVGTSYTTEFDLSDNTRYYWQVTARDLSGATYETEVQSFIVNLENDNPDMFSLLAPENTSMIVDLTPTFYWEVPIDQDDARRRSIENYFIYYGTGIEDLTVEVVNSNSFTVMDPLIEDTTYFWKVVARDDDGGETQTDTWSFWTNSVNSSPNDFTLLTPEENQHVNLRPTFSWTESSDSDLYDEIGYTIQIGTDPFNLEDVTPPAQVYEENFSVEFDGQDDFIEIEYFEGLDISENYTWMFDVQFYDINSNAMLIENNSFYNTDGYYINYVDSRLWFSLCSDGTCYQYSTSENNFLNDTWYNIQIVKLDGVMSIYVDGVNATDEVSYNITPEEDISQYYVPNTESLIIGLNTSGDSQPFSGKIDRLSLWGMALDEMQVEYYDVTSPSGLEEGIIGYWNFNQGDGDIVSDLSGNENNGTLNGTAWVQEEDADVGQNDNITYYLPQDDFIDNTEYYWQVTAFDQSGATFSTPMQSFFINSDNDNPTGFTLQSPDSGSSIPNSSEILLFWDLTTDIDGDQVSYELYFGNNSETMELVDVVGVNYYEMQNLIEETYFWSVTAYDDLGGSVSSAVWSFEVVSATNNAPLPFSILSPSNGGQSDSPQVDLIWELTTDFDLGDTVSYQVELGENVNSLNTVYNGSETVFTTEELLDNTTYYWRVIARDLNGAATENDGGIFTFTVNTENDLPSDFALLLPENGAVVTDLTPTFMWEEPTDEDDEVASIGTGLSPFNPNIFQLGTNRRGLSIQPGLQRLSFDGDRNSNNSRSIISYDVYIGTDTLFTDIIPVEVEVNNYTPTESLTEDTTYYWKVLATDNDGGQTESIIQSFTTNSQNSAPSEFALLTPFFGEEVDTLPVIFNWTESFDLDINLGDEVMYVMEIGENINDMETIYTGPDTVFTTDQLLDNTNYYWRVLATDLNGASTENMGGIHSFMVNMENDLPGNFALFFPEDGSMVTDLTPTLMWEEPDDQDDALAFFRNQTFSLKVNRHLQNNVENSFPPQIDNARRSSTNSRSIEGYNVFISSDILFTEIDPVRIDSNSYTIDTSLAENVEYFWKIVAIDDDGGQTESAIYSFWTNSQNSPPNEIDLLTPERDAVTGTRPLFSWTESSDYDINDNVSYTLVYGSDVTSLIYIEVDDELSHFTNDSLLDNTEYYWQVIATDGSGASFTTDLQSFFVNAENDSPEGFALLSPDSGSVVQGFDQYLIWLSSIDLDGETVEYEVFLNDQSIGVTNHNYMEVRDLMDDAIYEWYVIANDGIGGVTTSATWIFTVNAENNLPSEFSLLSPSDEALLASTSITFTWQSSSDVDIYDLVEYRIHIESEDTSMVIETGDTSLFIEDFIDNQIYHWSVIAYDRNGGTTNNTDGSRMFIVNLGNDTPSIVSITAPNEGSTQSDLTPNFSWTNSYDPDPLDMISYSLSWWEPFSTDIQSVNIDTNGFTPNGYLMDNAIYQWCVKSEDLLGAASFSDTVYFYTDAFAEPPFNFSTIAPDPDASMSSTVVNFKWYSTIDPDPNEVIKYRVAYSTDWSDTSTYVYTAEIEDTSMSILLNDNLQYFWVAQAIDKDDFVVSSNYNTPNTFIIGTLSTEENLIPDEFAVHQNFPNPFNPTTTIKYDLPNDEDIEIKIFDVVGRKIRSLMNQKQSAGYHRTQWDAKNDYGEPVSAGMYIYIIQAGEHRSVKKMVLLK